VDEFFQMALIFSSKFACECEVGVVVVVTSREKGPGDHLSIVLIVDANILIPSQFPTHRLIWWNSDSDNQAHIVTLLSMGWLAASINGSSVPEGVVDLNKYRSTVRVLVAYWEMLPGGDKKNALKSHLLPLRSPHRLFRGKGQCKGEPMP